MNRIQKAIAVLSLAAMSVPNVAAAQDFELHIGRDGPRYYDGNRRYERDDYRRERRERYSDNPGGCSVQLAMRKASRYLDSLSLGLTSNSRIEIKGLDRRGNRTRAMFANRPGCPQIG